MKIVIISPPNHIGLGIGLNIYNKYEWMLAFDILFWGICITNNTTIIENIETLNNKL